MSEPTVTAKSPIAAASPTAVLDGWEVSGRRARALLTLVDETPRAKVLLKGGPTTTSLLGVPMGQAARDEEGVLVTGAGPGEWLLVAEPNTAGQLAERMQQALSGAEELVTAIDFTHSRALMRLTGQAAPDLLAKVCAADFAASTTPNGSTFRSSVARLATDIARDDRGDTRSYLLHCERSSGQYLFDALQDAGAEFGIDVDGFHPGT